MNRGRLLLVTIPPFRGGVPAKAAILARHLRNLGWRVTVAYYATLSDHPDLVAPLWRLATGAKPGERSGRCWDDFPCHAVGCRFPELESSYTRASPAWRRLVGRHDRHIAVGGNPLVANILVECGVPHLLWCAATVEEDRAARARAMPWMRRLVDQLVVRPALLKQQRRVLNSPLCTPAGVSVYTCRLLAQQGAVDPHLMPIPTDMNRFSPRELLRDETSVVGFAARLGDPRKRVPLLLDAVRIMKERGLPVLLRLAGDAPNDLRALARRSGLEGSVQFLGHLPDDALPDFYRSLDVFALPSSQEGFGIAGLEAMACGVPVVAAQRGSGPDDYVIDGVTGVFSDASASSLAQCLADLLSNPGRRQAMSVAARRLAVERYSHEAFSRSVAQVWHRAWRDAP